jgi:hypothetical protein
VKFPILIREGSVVVKIYRQRAPAAKSGWNYVVTWIGPDGRDKLARTDLEEAREEADRKAAQLAAGLEKGASRSDLLELAEARELAGDVPLLSAVGEWKKARELVGPAILEACHAWADRRMPKVSRILVKDAAEKFVAAKDAAGKQGTRTYSRKLKPLVAAFGDRYLDTITTTELTAFFAQVPHPVTRNDRRRRVVTLFLWARRQGYLPRGVETEAEQTDTATEQATTIGILEPETFDQVLRFFQKEYPHYLAAVVAAGLCGLRAAEVHGKLDSRDVRQVWEDIHLDRKFMSVTEAKANTPAHRIVHLSDAAIAWFRACPKPHEGPICAQAAIERVREIAIHAGFKLPPNCFRHSWISYKIALTGDKIKTANEAGNSVRMIDQRYRVPLPKFLGKAWFATRP